MEPIESWDPPAAQAESQNLWIFKSRKKASFLCFSWTFCILWTNAYADFNFEPFLSPDVQNLANQLGSYLGGGRFFFSLVS